MSGWFKAPTADWPVIAEMIPRPWPLEAVRMDLAYLADRSRLTGEEIPGGRELGTRWGWGHKKVRLLLDKIKTENSGAQLGHKKGTERTHHKEVEAEQFERKGHKKGTERAQLGHTSNILYTEAETESEEKEKINKKEKDLPGEGTNQGTNASPNQAPFLEKTEDISCYSPIVQPKDDSVDSEKNGVKPLFDSQTEPGGLTPLPPASRFSSESVDSGKNGVKTIFDSQTEPGGLTPLPPASRSNRSETRNRSVLDADTYKDTTGTQNERNASQDENAGHTGQVFQLIKTPPEQKTEPELVEKLEKQGFKVPLESLAVLEVWKEHRRHHPKVAEKASKAIYGIVKSAYNHFAGSHDQIVEDMVLMVEAANCCPHRLFSYDIRAIGWDGGIDRSGDLDTIFRHKRIPARLEAAKEWAEKGKLKQDIFDNFVKKTPRNANSPPDENHFLNSLFGSKKQENQTIIDVEHQTIAKPFFKIMED